MGSPSPGYTKSDPVPDDLQPGDEVRVWPGARPGRSGVTTTRTGVQTLGGTVGVFVHATHEDHNPDPDAEPRAVPSGFYALTHVERVSP